MWIKDVKEKIRKLIPECKNMYKDTDLTLQENIEFYQNKLRFVESLEEDVMNRFFNISTNKCKPMLVEKTTLNRIIQKHGNNGLINISAWRSNLDKETNERNTQSLIQDIKDENYGFLPGYGGYRDTELGEEADFEPSFNVFNYDTNGNPKEFEELKKFGIKMAKKYNQSSVLIKAPGENPIYLNGDGIKINSRESDAVNKNDKNQEFFTSLVSLDKVDKFKEEDLRKQYRQLCKEKGVKPDMGVGFENFKKEHMKNANVNRRYTYDIGFDECYVNPSPCDLIERKMRKESGEILVDLELF